MNVKGARAELAEFAWHYAKTRGFPKMKDKGMATAAISGLDINVGFEIVVNSSGGMTLSNMKGRVTLAQLNAHVNSGHQN